MILFDLGGVLVENTVFEALDVLLGRAVEPAGLRARWLASPSVRALERGDIDCAEFGARFVQEWGLALAPGAFLERFAGWPRGACPGAEDLVADLRERGPVGCLSNSNALHWERLAPILGWFDHAVSSHQLGVVKPDAAAFLAALERVGAQPRETLFFDD